MTRPTKGQGGGPPRSSKPPARPRNGIGDKKPSAARAPKGQKQTAKNKDTSAKKTTSNKSRPRKKPARKERKASPARFLGLLRIAVMLATWATLVVLVFVAWYGHDLPSIQKISLSSRPPSITYLDLRGQVFGTSRHIQRDPVQSAQLPQHVTSAFIAIEDRRFRQHFGIDVWGMVRALWRNLRAGGVRQGASTITQQLAKNFLLSCGHYHYTDRSMRRKAQELLIALWLEHTFTKEQILSMYLNRAYFGRGAYGLGAASHVYFGCPPEKLSVGQAALLAGLLKAPNTYTPYRDPKASAARTALVLQALRDFGVLSPEQLQQVIAHPIRVKNLNKRGAQQNFFMDWLDEEITEVLGVIADDLVVHTTLDGRLQDKAARIAVEFYDRNRVTYGAEQMGAVILSPGGAVRAMIGGSDYQHNQYNHVTHARRQTGSVFKLVPYSAAIEKGISLAHPVRDGPLCIGDWCPKNYGWQTRGQLSLGAAFAYSVNTAAVRVARYAGLQEMHAMAARLGLEPAHRHGVTDLTYALGTTSVRLLDITAAFATFAHEGRRVRPYGITRIRTAQGRVLYHKKETSGSPIIRPATTQAMRALLEAVMTYGTGRRLHLGRPCFGKSGTSQNYRDAWFIGFDDTYVTGVWLGNDDETPMNKITGAKGSGRLWQALMQGAVHKN